MATYNGVRWIYGNTISFNGGTAQACFAIDLDSISDTQMQLQIQPRFGVFTAPNANTNISWNGTYGSGSMLIGRYTGAYEVGECPMLTVTPGFSKTQTLSVTAGGKTSTLTYVFKAPKWNYSIEDFVPMLKVYLNDELFFDGSKPSGERFLNGSFFRKGFIKPAINMSFKLSVDFPELPDLFYTYFGFLRPKAGGTETEWAAYNDEAIYGNSLAGEKHVIYEAGTLKDMVDLYGHDSFYSADCYLNEEALSLNRLHDGDFVIGVRWFYNIVYSSTIYKKAPTNTLILSTNNVVDVAGKPALLFLYDGDGDLVNGSTNKQKIFIYDSSGNKKETCLF